jgi:cytochrome c peroxidase
VSPLRLLNVACRTLHLVGVSLLAGGAAWDVSWERLQPALWITLTSGLGLLLLEVAADQAWLCQGRGLAAALKLVPLTLIPFWPDHRASLLLAAVVVASLGSHMPRRFRHAVLTDELKRLAARPAHAERGSSMKRAARFGLLVTSFLLVAAPVAAESPAPLPPLSAGKPEQVELGKLLFFDPRLSGDGGFSCDTCHDPAKGWGDGKPLSAGYPGSEYFRNSQTLLNAAHYKRNYWDGRMAGSDLPTLVRDHLTEAHFMQVDGRLVTERLKQVPEYVDAFQKAFGAEPSFGRTIGAVAAFVRTLTSRNAPIDRYLKGDQAALTAEARVGFELFEGKARCVQCHGGPLFSDEKFHALGVPDHPQIFADAFRHISFRRFFRTLGAPGVEGYTSDPGLYGVTKLRTDWGKFRTPSLREVSRTAPYMHNGTLATLEAVVAFYNAGGGTHANKSPRLRPLGLTVDEQRALVEFLESLSGDPVVIERPELPDYQPRALGKN